LFTFIFSLGYVYLCYQLPCTFDGWVPILDFDLQVFLLYVVANSLIFAINKINNNKKSKNHSIA